MSNPIVKALEHAAEKLGKTLGKDAGKAVEDLYHGAGTRLKKVATNHAENDAKHAREMENLLKGGKEDIPHAPHPSGSSGRSEGGTPAGGGSGRSGGKSGNEPNGTARDQLNKDHPHNNTRQDGSVEECGDPVDVATGRVFLRQTDITLPGALPLSFTRKFESSYRVGRHLGPSWSCTVDQRLEIDDHGLVFVTEDGLLLSYAFPEPGEHVLPAAGPRWTLTRTVRGDWAVHQPETGHTRYFTPTPHTPGVALLDEICDRNNNWIAFDYDDTGAPLGLRHSAGYHLTFTSDEHTRITGMRLAGAGDDGSDVLIASYEYDAAGNLATVTRSCGIPTRYEYDDAHRMTAWVDTNDSRYEYVYDAGSRCIRQGGVDGHLNYRYDYDEVDPGTGHRVTAATNSHGHTTRYLINERLQVTAKVDPLGNTTYTEFDQYDRVLRTRDALGRTTRYTYDEEGRLATVVRPDGRESASTYNELGLTVSVRDVAGGIWRHEYDERGNRTLSMDPSGATTRYAYDARGHLAAVTNALGETTRVDCDAAGLPVAVTNPLGAVTRLERDGFGRMISLTNPLGERTQLIWTVEGRLAEGIAPDGSRESWTYDGEGNCLSHTDASGGRTRSEYTHFDQLLAQTGPDGARHEFTHDTELRLIQVTNPQGLTWTYDYDAAGRLVRETDFDSRTLRYTHNAAGQLATRVNALGQTTAFTYDDLGQIAEKNADGHLTTYTHDAAGRLIQASGPEATLLYHRDRLGRVEVEECNGRALSFAYDVLGRRSRRTTPSGVTSTWTYDAAGRRTGLTASGHALAFERDAVGRELARHLGADLSLTTTWDAAGRRATQTLLAGAGGPTGTGTGTRSLQHRSYTYRPDGNLIAIDDQLNGPSSFDLDMAGRVTTVRAADWTETYAYDEAGNQAQADWPTTHAGSASHGARTYDGTRITGAGRIRYEHDAQGRITLRQRTRLSRRPDTWRYTWDAQDHLTHVVTPDGTTWRYRYDPLGRRIAKQRLDDDGAVVEQTDFTWDGTTLAEQTTLLPGHTSHIVLTWDHDGLHPIAQTERKLTGHPPMGEPGSQGAAHASQRIIDQRFFAMVTDLVGTPTELVDESGDIAWRTRSTLWGTATWNADARAYTPLRFPGQYFDPETGFHYNFHRYYDPETARYASSDPLGLAPSPNPAAYVRNPHRWTDPLGLSCKDGDEGSNEPTPGIATVHYHGEGNHFSVEVTDGDRVMHTHLMPHDGEAVVEPYMGSPSIVSRDLDLPDAGAALNFQRDNQGSWGPYHPLGNSCLTYVAHVLRAGGAEVPEGKAAIPWARKFMGGGQ
ncbi:MULTISPECIES: DUF6531 domain-containing protein [Streptomyces]|uniref:RHS repeat protein n=1 Tax=Streptomyces siderophoricus TaxID=2802281 RepID=A0ABS1MJG2_9ACTN|nr:DUF6531 domain-containing protein [Streptomyces sp. 9-7]MBL1088130.1 RHS repeat protein [Streptomyces sp. 9-7]